jgi:hypothetical protein
MRDPKDVAAAVNIVNRIHIVNRVNRILIANIVNIKVRRTISGHAVRENESMSFPFGRQKANEPSTL